jgi:hypothetical protein
MSPRVAQAIHDLLAVGLAVGAVAIGVIALMTFSGKSLPALAREHLRRPTLALALLFFIVLVTFALFILLNNS